VGALVQLHHTSSLNDDGGRHIQQVRKIFWLEPVVFPPDTVGHEPISELAIKVICRSKFHL